MGDRQCLLEYNIEPKGPNTASRMCMVHDGKGYSTGWSKRAYYCPLLPWRLSPQYLSPLLLQLNVQVGQGAHLRALVTAFILLLYTSHLYQQLLQKLPVQT